MTLDRVTMAHRERESLSDDHCEQFLSSADMAFPLTLRDRDDAIISFTLCRREPSTKEIVGEKSHIVPGLSTEESRLMGRDVE